MSFGLPLRDEGDEKCLSILNSVEETIARQLRACKAQALSRKKTLEGLESLQDNPDLEEDYCRALLCRLRFPFLPCCYMLEETSWKRIGVGTEACCVMFD
jgi:hypothetical protein